jgi:hypothetical protein
LFEVTDVMPAFLQTPPAFTAALAGISGKEREMESIDKKAISLICTYQS